MTLDLTDWQSKKYTTRYGCSVRILCIDAPTKQPIVGIITHEDDTHSIETWCLDGRYHNSGKEGLADLINAKTKREGWVNIYEQDDRCCPEIGYAYPTKELADKSAYKEDRIACIRIEWEE